MMIAHSAGDTQVVALAAAAAAEAEGMATEVAEEAAEAAIANRNKHRMKPKDRLNMSSSLKTIQLPLRTPQARQLLR